MTDYRKEYEKEMGRPVKTEHGKAIRETYAIWLESRLSDAERQIYSLHYELREAQQVNFTRDDTNVFQWKMIDEYKAELKEAEAQLKNKFCIACMGSFADILIKKATTDTTNEQR